MASSFKLRSDLLKPPTLRGGKGDGERHATWLELFSDLAFVAAVGQIGAVLTTDFSWRGVLQALLLFVPIWWAWIGNTFYLSRFDSDDIGHRAMGLVQIGLVVLLAVSVPEAMDRSPGIFALAYAGLRVLLVFQYWQAGRFNRQTVALTTAYAQGFAVSPVLWIFSIWTPAPWNYALWIVGLIYDLTFPMRAKVKPLQLAFPPSETHLPERFGLFTIIVLGEAILAAVTAAQLSKSTFDFWFIGGFGLLISFALWWVYFEGVKGSDARIPSTKREVGLYQLWFYSHLPLQFSIVIVAVGVKLAMKAADGQVLNPTVAWILLAGTAGAMLSFHAIYFSTLTDCLRARAIRISIPFWVVTLVTPLVGMLMMRQSAILYIGSISVMFLLHVGLTLRETRLPSDPQREEIGDGSVS